MRARAKPIILIYVKPGLRRDDGLCRIGSARTRLPPLQGDDRAAESRPAALSTARRTKNAACCATTTKGSLFWNELSLYPINDDAGLRRLVGVMRSATSLVTSEQALRSSLEREKLALTFAGVGMFSWDVRGGYVNASEIMLRLLGIPGSAPNLDQASLRSRVHEDDRPVFDDAIKLCRQGISHSTWSTRVLWQTQHPLAAAGDVEECRVRAARAAALPQSGHHRAQGV